MKLSSLCLFSICVPCFMTYLISSFSIGPWSLSVYSMSALENCLSPTLCLWVDGQSQGPVLIFLWTTGISKGSSHSDNETHLLHDIILSNCTKKPIPVYFPGTNEKPKKFFCSELYEDLCNQPLWINEVNISPKQLTWSTNRKNQNKSQRGWEKNWWQ